MCSPEVIGIVFGNFNTDLCSTNASKYCEMKNRRVCSKIMTMTITEHVTQLCRSINWQIRNIYRFRSFIDFETCHRIVHVVRSLGLSKLDYCNVLLNGLSKKDLKRLQKLLNKMCSTYLSNTQIPITSQQASTNFIGSQSQTASSTKLFSMFLNLSADSLHFTLTRA